MITWTINTVDDHYLGQSDALHPKVALCIYLITAGQSADLRDIESIENDDGTCILTYRGTAYRLGVLWRRSGRLAQSKGLPVTQKPSPDVI